MDLTDGALYTHLEKLIGAGYIAKQRAIAGTAVQTLYTPTPGGLSLFRDYINFMKELIGSEEGKNS